jgi:putative DNA primase/helicase
MTMTNENMKGNEPDTVTAMTPMTANSETIPPTSKVGLLAMMEDQIVEKFHDKSGEAYITVNGGEGKPTRTVPVESKACSMLIRGSFYRTEGRGIDKRKLEDIQNTLMAAAVFDGDCKETHIRVARTEDGGVEIDLGDDTGRCVYVSGEQRTLREPMSRFVRPDGFGVIPVDPKAKADFDKLWDHVNVTDETDRTLIAGWLVMALRGKGPYPILTIQGQHGSAKSTTTKMLRLLADPGSGEGRSMPSNEDNLFIATKGGHILALDNLSGMSHQMSDGFCRVSTGGTLAKRKHYSNGEEVRLEACVPIIFNGIDDIISKPDLHNRAIVIHLPRIPNDKRMDEDTLWANFEADRPAIFNGLLKALKSALQYYDSIKLSESPRMADFARFATAAEKGFNFEDGVVINAIMQRQNEAKLSNLEIDPVAPRITKMFEDQDRRETIEGTATELWEMLTPYIDKPSNWPKTASHFSQHLSRITPDLRAVGVIVERPPRSSGRRAIEITKVEVDDI